MTHECAYTHDTRVCPHTCTHKCTWKFAYTHTDVNTCTHTHTHTHGCAHVCGRARAHTHTHTHAHTHTHTLLSAASLLATPDGTITAAVGAQVQAEVECLVQMYTADQEDRLLAGGPTFVLDAIDNIDTKVGGFSTVAAGCTASNSIHAPMLVLGRVPLMPVLPVTRCSVHMRRVVRFVMYRAIAGKYVCGCLWFLHGACGQHALCFLASLADR